MTKTIKQLAQDALDVQDACNMLGVSKAFAKALQDLKDELERTGQYTGTNQINQHSITVLWTNKMATLSGGDSIAKYGEAYHTCCELVLNESTP